MSSVTNESELGGVTLYQMRSGAQKWRVRMVVAGKRESFGLYESEDEAWAVLHSLREQLGAKAGGHTLVTWMMAWLDRRELDGLHRSMRSQRSIFNARISKARFARWPIRRITRQDIVAWNREQLRTAPAPGFGQQQKQGRTSRRTVSNTLNVLRCALSDAADEGIIPTNPADGVRVPRVPTTERGWTFLEEDEIARLMALPIAPPGKRPRGTISLKQHTAFVVDIFAGLREGELWGMRWADVHLSGDRPRLVVRYSFDEPTKGGRVRDVPLVSQAIRALRTWKKQAPGVGKALVFPSATGSSHCEGYDAGWPRVRRLLELNRRVRFHDLRHTCASHLVMGTFLLDEHGNRRPQPLHIVRDVLGHRSIKTTEMYAHLAPGAVHDALRAVPASGQHGDNNKPTEHG